MNDTSNDSAPSPISDQHDTTIMVRRRPRYERALVVFLALGASIAACSSDSDSDADDDSDAAGAAGKTPVTRAGSGGDNDDDDDAGRAGKSATGGGGAKSIGGAGGAGGANPMNNPAFAQVADGWASVTSPAGPATKGGVGADATHTYTVTNRQELIKALYPDAQIVANGTFTSVKGADATPKIIYIKGTINMNTNLAGVEQKESDYACSGYSFDQYKAAYNPKTWNQQALVNGKPPLIPACPLTTQEALRACSELNQVAVVRVRVGSNTSIFGLGTDAKIIHGGLVVAPPPPPLPMPCAGTGGAGGAGSGGASSGGAGGTSASGASSGGASGSGASSGGAGGAGGSSPAATVDNVVIRNITFEDSFQFFPQWSPTDTYPTPPAAAVATSLEPKCQATYDAATDNGPHQCGGGRWKTEIDNITVQNATHVWVDHCTFNDGMREDHLYPSVWQAPYVGHNYYLAHHHGSVDVTLASDFVTLSYNYFYDHDTANLLGGTDTVAPETGWGALSVTLHDNYWKDCGQRMPRARFGKVHVYNNYTSGQLLPVVQTAADLAKVPSDNPLTYPVGIGYLAKLYMEANVFEITPFPGDAAPTEKSSFYLWHKAAPTTGTGLDVNQSTYFFDSGSTFNGAATNLLATANMVAAASIPVLPALVSTDTVWKPSSSYMYQPRPVAEVKANVMAKAGAGKL